MTTRAELVRTAPHRSRRRPTPESARVRIATWNVNSVKQRLPRLLPWLDERRPDVVCLQETKLADDAFARAARRRARRARLRGRRARRGGLERRRDPVAGRARGRRRRASRAARASRTRRRGRCPRPAAASASSRSTCPTAATPDSDHYRYKLEWLAALREVVAARPDATVVCGDMNIAPDRRGRLRPRRLRRPDPRHRRPSATRWPRCRRVGLRDVVRERWPDERVFTYWDYRAGMFHQDLRDADRPRARQRRRRRAGSQAAWVDRQARKGKGPSDHAPVIVDLDEAPDGDIGPVVPPPSRPADARGQAAAAVRSIGPRLSLRAVAVARRLHALGLARHLRVVGRIGHVALALPSRS